MTAGQGFLAATSPQPSDEPGRFSLAVDESWLQGKGVFGGVPAGALARAFTAVVADDARALRTLHVHFSAPLVPGDAEVEVDMERAGATVAHLVGRIRQEGRVTNVATATFALPRETVAPPWNENPLPRDALPYDEVEPVLPPPVFTQHFEYRFALGHLPWSGAPLGRVGGWVRPRTPTELDPALACALLDAYPPASMAPLKERVHSTSVDMTLDLAVPLPTDVANDAAYLVEATSARSAGGYADEHARLWTQGGRFLGRVRQLVALLG